ncbi:hypothetical protein BDW71DRAFT_212236 [Aspergillus fruticulosus]
MTLTLTLSQKYAALVDSGFIEYLGQNGNPSELPDDYRNYKKKLSKAQTERLKDKVEAEFIRINKTDDDQLLQDFASVESKEQLKLILDMADQLGPMNVPNPSERLVQILSIALNDTSQKETGGSNSDSTEKKPEEVKKVDPPPGEGSDSDLDDSDSEFGYTWEPGRGKERSAPPMDEGKQEELQEVLREHCQLAIPELRKYLLGDWNSARSLKHLNSSMQQAILDRLVWPSSSTARFRIPYKKFKDVVDLLVLKPLQSPGSESHEKEYADKIG